MTNCFFTTVNLQMLIALYAHREFHDLRARDVGVERCSCALCLNDDAAIQGAIKMEERYKPILQRAFSDYKGDNRHPTATSFASDAAEVHKLFNGK
jgi:hypothetical protein